MVKMSEKEKKQRKKKAKCFADLVEEVPKVITNTKYGTSYEQLHFIGSGSYGKCFEVVKMSTKERFACKVLSKVLIQDPDYTNLVQNEISIHRKLKHEHIVEFVKSFEDDKLIYIIQSLCSNHSLRDLHKARGVVSVDECRYFVSQILKGAQHIHDKLYIHRDLKLTNILIDKNMQMKICDFGLAIRVGDPRLDSKTICGTTNYLAPEVVSRKGFVCLSDVWAIGVITFVLMFGYKPFEEFDAYQTHQRILRADYLVPAETDFELKHFLRCVFEKDVVDRSSARECLRLSFFKKHIIPQALPFEAFSRGTKTETKKIQSYSPLKDINFSRYVEVNKTVVIEYPIIFIKAKPTIKKSYENAKYAYELDKVFHQLDFVCRYLQIDSANSFDDLSEIDDFKPDYWIAKWTYDKSVDSGFAYEMSDGSKGILFHDGLKLMRTPDGDYLALEPGYDRFWRINGDDSRLNRELEQFYNFEIMLEKNGIFMPETKYNQRRITYLYTWFQTGNAVVMLLNNNTIQINFMCSHKKVIISMEKQKISFVTGRMATENFRTVSFTTLSNHGFSLLSIGLLKYVTATVQHLAEKLKEA